MTTNTNSETTAQQAQGEADRQASAPQAEESTWSSITDGISSFFTGSRSFFQGTVKNGVREMTSYGDSVIDGVDTMRDLATNKPFEMAEGFVFGLFSWDWGKSFSFSQNYNTQATKASSAWNDILNGFESAGASMNPTRLLDIFGLSGQQITTPTQESAVNGNDGSALPSNPNDSRGMS